MTASLPQLIQKREDILQQIQSIDRLRRGTLSEQFFTKKLKGKSVRRGPYYVLQCFIKGTKRSERVSAQQAQQAQQDVSNYQRFQQLADQFVEVTDQVTRLERGQSQNSKKKSRPRK